MLRLSSRILSEYLNRTQKSQKLAARARELFPSGITHDGRYLEPYPIYVTHAQGSRKWDVDGNEYVDYFGGHGALLLGHAHPKITEAVEQQIGLGTHYGASHELEIRWAELVTELVPSAERVRFTNSGTEATLMAYRLARAATGKPRLVRLLDHFHGWQDHVAFGVSSHHNGTATPGVLTEVVENAVLCPPGDIDAMRDLLLSSEEIAAVILEPTGASWGHVPITGEYLHALRELTAEQDVLLIFDEVVSGFRVSPGGAQGHYGITPDLTTLAKILAGGLPGGALVGRKDILDLLDFQECAAQGREKVPHQGTFNANPLCAATGIAALEIVANTPVCQQANDYAARLREELARVLREEQVDWVVYGSFSGFHIFLNPEHEPITADQIDSGLVDHRKLKDTESKELLHKIRLGMLIGGVDICGWPGGPTSAVHTPEDLQRTSEAFRQTLRMLKEDGEIGG